MNRLPNVEERVILKEMGFNPKDFLRTDKDFESFTFIQLKTNKKLMIRR